MLSNKIYDNTRMFHYHIQNIIMTKTNSLIISDNFIVESFALV